jgi:hypothetical protein
VTGYVRGDAPSDDASGGARQPVAGMAVRCSGCILCCWTELAGVVGAWRHSGFDADFETLHERLSSGWTVQAARLSESYALDKIEDRLGELGRDWFLLGGVTSGGELRIRSSEPTFTPEAGWTPLYFAPGRG